MHFGTTKIEYIHVFALNQSTTRYKYSGRTSVTLFVREGGLGVTKRESRATGERRNRGREGEEKAYDGEGERRGEGR